MRKMLSIISDIISDRVVICYVWPYLNNCFFSVWPSIFSYKSSTFKQHNSLMIGYLNGKRVERSGFSSLPPKRLGESNKL